MAEFKQVYSGYSKAKLSEMLSHQEEYQEDAIAAAQFLFDNDIVTEDDDDETVNVSKKENQEWYYALNGNRKGPVSEGELVQLFQSEVIAPTTMVWKQGLTDWVNIMHSDINIPSKSESTPPPLAANQVNNKSIILLLFVPIISTLIQFVIAGLFKINANKLWWVGYGLNCVCCSIDYCRVRKAGYNADKLTWAFLFLIPLYIYKRMAMVKGHKWLFTFIWTTVFIIDILIPNVFGLKRLECLTLGLSGWFKRESFIVTQIKQ